MSETAVSDAQVAHVRNKIATDPRSVEWAILQLDARQTEDEHRNDHTKHLNHRGWNMLDASFGGSLARQIKEKRDRRIPAGSCLTGPQVQKARKMLRKYAVQVTRIIAEVKAKPVVQTALPRSKWHPTQQEEPF
jgi:hypothetical protein